MCFSPVASFGAAAGLFGIGAMSVARARSRELLPLAAIPLIFGAQQVSEGFVWLTLEHAPYWKSAAPIGRVFLFFALFVWPAYVPASLACAEPDPMRRRLLGALAVIGTLLGAYLLGCAVFRPSYACLAFGNLYYGVAYDAAFRQVTPFAYVAVILAPLLVSTVRGTATLALLTAASFAAAGILFRVGFASVWCFFAALISGVVALVAARPGRGPATA